MDRKHRKKIGCAFAFGTIIALVISAPLAAATSIQVVQVTHNDVVDAEPFIAVNPLDPKNVVAAWISGTTESYSCTYGASFDGGRSWNHIGPLPGVPPPFSGDPTVAFDKDGNAYFSCGVGTGPAGRGVDLVSRSTDGGLTWGAPVVGFPTTSDLKGAGFIKISTNPANGDIYLAGGGGPAQEAGHTRIYLTRSTDHGASFSDPIRIDSPSDGAWAWPGYAAGGVESGTVYVAYGAASSSNQCCLNYDQIFIAKSTDGGATFSAGQKILDVVPLQTSLPNFTGFLVEADLWAAVDRTSGEIYVNFVDYRNGDADVWLLRMHDTGDAFVSDGVVRVNDDPVGNGADQFFPFLSLAPNGRVDICFEDRRYAADNNLVFMTCAYSSDGGQSFTNIQVTTVGFDATNNFRIGDYRGQASTDRMVVPIFISDGFPGADWFGQEVFVARVAL